MKLLIRMEYDSEWYKVLQVDYYHCGNDIKRYIVTIKKPLYETTIYLMDHELKWVEE